MKRCPQCGRMAVEYNEKMKAWCCLVQSCSYYEPANGKDLKAKEPDQVSKEELDKQLKRRISELKAL